MAPVILADTVEYLLWRKLFLATLTSMKHISSRSLSLFLLRASRQRSSKNISASCMLENGCDTVLLSRAMLTAEVCEFTRAARSKNSWCPVFAFR